MGADAAVQCYQNMVAVQMSGGADAGGEPDSRGRLAGGFGGPRERTSGGLLLGLLKEACKEKNRVEKAEAAADLAAFRKAVTTSAKD